MGSDLQLTGLASGFDWAPVVEQLIELERIPQKRLEREKQDNEEKMSDLSLLKSQLDTLNGAGKALGVMIGLGFLMLATDLVKEGKKLADLIEGSEVHIIQNCGHMMLLEEADKTLAILKIFILENYPAV